MVRTQIVGDPAGCGRIVVRDTLAEAIEADPLKIFQEGGLLVIDHPPWSADFNVLAQGLERQARRFKEPYYTVEPEGALAMEISRCKQDAAAMFRALYPQLDARDGQHVTMRASWRPMITSGEPMHLDTYGGDNPLVTSYINISSVPRVYCIGPTLQQLCETNRQEMRQLVRGNDAPYALYLMRQKGIQGKGPMGKRCPRVRVELAPGSIWFFNAKILSHEVVHGEGAIGVSWEVPGAAEMPPEVFGRLL